MFQGSMPSVQHASLALDVPAGWTDQSTLLFVAPAAELNGVVPGRAAPGEAIAVRFAAATGRSAGECLQEQLRAVQLSDPKARLASESDFQCGLGAGRLAELELELAGERLSQLVACVVVGPVAVVASASCGSAAFPQQRAQLLSVLSSLRAVA
jgi:hypothetical protein